MKKRILYIALTFMFLLGLCGCEFMPANTDKLLIPPQLTGDYYPIFEALTNRVGDNYTLRYPSGGGRRSAVVLEDVDGDGTMEAFAFYSLADEEMHVNVICRKKNKWKSSDDQSFTAGGIERVDFCDLDSDGIKEVLIGWEIYAATDKQLSIYKYKNGKLEQSSLQRYTEYIWCDLDSDGGNELFIQQLSATDSLNRASLYKIEDGNFTEIGSCMLDKNAKTVQSITQSPLSNGQSAVYIDELKNSGAVTEIVFLSKGQLVNPLLESTTGENARTARSALLSMKDINQDGIIEIPIAQEMPSAEGPDATEKAYYTRWSSFNGETLIVQRTELINHNDGYSIAVPEKWIGRTVMLKDTKERRRIIYSCDEEMNPVECLVEVYAYNISEWENKEVKRPERLEEICRTSDSVIVGRAAQSDTPLAITSEELKKIVYLYQ